MRFLKFFLFFILFTKAGFALTTKELAHRYIDYITRIGTADIADITPENFSPIWSSNCAKHINNNLIYTDGTFLEQLIEGRKKFGQWQFKADEIGVNEAARMAYIRYHITAGTATFHVVKFLRFSQDGFITVIHEIIDDSSITPEKNFADDLTNLTALSAKAYIDTLNFMGKNDFGVDSFKKFWADNLLKIVNDQHVIANGDFIGHMIAIKQKFVSWEPLEIKHAFVNQAARMAFVKLGVTTSKDGHDVVKMLYFDQDHFLTLIDEIILDGEEA